MVVDSLTATIGEIYPVDSTGLVFIPSLLLTKAVVVVYGPINLVVGRGLKLNKIEFV